jgi:lipoate-protein ligase B
MTLCRYVNLNTLGYQKAWSLQRYLAARRAVGGPPNTLLLLEHPHVITLGRRGTESDVLVPAAERDRLGLSVVHTDRGGLATYHGPGQLVGYPIIDLRAWGGGPVTYVRALEEVLVRTANAFGVAAERRQGLPGAWVGERKLAAIGVRVTRGVTMHGFALNVNTDLSFFKLIVPCGMPEAEATSLERELGKRVGMDEVRQAVVTAFGEVLEFETRAGSSEELLATADSGIGE